MIENHQSSIIKDLGWAYVITFKEGRLPSVWDEFQRLLPLCTDNVRNWMLPDNTRRVFRWVHDLSYTDSDNRRWSFHALLCDETSPEGVVQRFAWLTNLPVSASTVDDIAAKGGRALWRIENEGFNRQKNSGLNLEHVYSKDPEKWKAYYYLLQIAFILTQLVERGSLLRSTTARLCNCSAAWRTSYAVCATHSNTCAGPTIASTKPPRMRDASASILPDLPRLSRFPDRRRLRSSRHSPHPNGTPLSLRTHDQPQFSDPNLPRIGKAILHRCLSAFMLAMSNRCGSMGDDFR